MLSNRRRAEKRFYQDPRTIPRLSVTNISHFSENKASISTSAFYQVTYTYIHPLPDPRIAVGYTTIPSRRCSTCKSISALKRRTEINRGRGIKREREKKKKCAREAGKRLRMPALAFVSTTECEQGKQVKQAGGQPTNSQLSSRIYSRVILAEPRSRNFAPALARSTSYDVFYSGIKDCASPLSSS